MTNQSELEHRPSCAIYRKPTPSGCYWCCDCKMTRFVAVKSESQQNKQSELVDKIHEFANGWLKPTAGVRVLDVEILVDYITANYTPRQSYIQLLNLFGTPTCESLHHPKKYQHRAVEDCPVVERITELTKGVTNDQL